MIAMTRLYANTKETKMINSMKLDSQKDYKEMNIDGTSKLIKIRRSRAKDYSIKKYS